MSDLAGWLNARLAEIESAHLRRRLRTVDSAQGPLIEREGGALVNFSSNDYLGLANDPRLRSAASAASERYGAGVGASRLISGSLPIHAQLETALAKFKRTEAALSFSTGYAAALGTIPSLVGEHDVVILDKLSHACLVDGARLSGAAIRVFPHNHLEKLERLLAWARENYAKANILVVTESVFSMDGDRAPLSEIVELKDRYGAWLLLDEAHGIGVIGERGRGLAAELGIAERVDIQMGTLGKALGSAGGTICGARKLIDFLTNRARSFIFSTAPVPAAAAAACEAVQLLDSGEAESLQDRLWENLSHLDPEASSAILPQMVGGEAEAVERSERLLGAGLMVPAIRYPTVARGQARLRISVSAAHSWEQIERLKSALCFFESKP